MSAKPQSADIGCTSRLGNSGIRITTYRPAVGMVGTAPISVARPIDQAVDVPGCPSTSKHLQGRGKNTQARRSADEEGDQDLIFDSLLRIDT